MLFGNLPPCKLACASCVKFTSFHESCAITNPPRALQSVQGSASPAVETTDLLDANRVPMGAGSIHRSSGASLLRRDSRNTLTYPAPVPRALHQGDSAASCDIRKKRPMQVRRPIRPLTLGGVWNILQSALTACRQQCSDSRTRAAAAQARVSTASR